MWPAGRKFGTPALYTMLYSWYSQTFNFLVHQSFCYTSYCQSIQGSLTQWTGWCNFRSLLSPSVNSRYRLTQFKVLYRFHNRFLPPSPPCVVNVVLHSHACCGLGQDIFDWFPKQCDSPVHLDCNLAKIDCSDETVFLVPSEASSKVGHDRCKSTDSIRMEISITSPF